MTQTSDEFQAGYVPLNWDNDKDRTVQLHTQNQLVDGEDAVPRCLTSIVITHVTSNRNC